MRWSISVKSGIAALAAVIAFAPAAYACPLCFASSRPGVLHAYLVSAYFMIGLAWGIIGAITLYAVRSYSEKPEQADRSTHSEEARSIESPGSPFE